MKLFNTYYDNFENLEDFVHLHKIQELNCSSCLVHVYSGETNPEILEKISSEILAILPHAQIIGATTAGEIMSGIVSSNKIAISINLFEKTQVKTYSFQDTNQKEEQIIAQLLDCCTINKIKGILVLSNGFRLHSDAILEAMNKLCPEIPIFGGVAGDNLQYQKQYVIHNQTVAEAMVAFSVFESEDLIIKTEYDLNWKPIGKLFTVTKATNNTLYEIDNQPAAEIVAKYMGEDTIKGLPASGLEFPLIFTRNKVHIARIMVRANDDGSLNFASKIYQGEQFQFSYGDIENIINKSKELASSLLNQSIEGIYVYSCISRRGFLQEATQLEVEPLQDVASNVGFFTYGEFFHRHSKCEFLNETMTLVTLTENISSLANHVPLTDSKPTSMDYVKQKRINVQKVLNHLITEVTKELNDRNILIEKQNQNIIDSIKYAQRIQNAILDTPDSIQKIVPQSFVLFKPKDIVSGDFYYIKQINHHLIIAAADCTGHGVPGAFMSMLGLTLLNEIVEKNETENAALILDKLRLQIKKSLQQTGVSGEQQDGMDIAFCIINTKTQRLSFAGAHNPLLLFRKSEMIELQSDRMPIGVFLRERPFTERTFQLQSGDTFYLFSDGYVSQFGGEKNEKFKSKRFQKLLSQIQDKPMNQQKIMLEETITDWKGNLNQTDDMLIIGIRMD